jgi:hypothetical protein
MHVKDVQAISRIHVSGNRRKARAVPCRSDRFSLYVAAGLPDPAMPVYLLNKGVL